MPRFDEGSSLEKALVKRRQAEAAATERAAAEAATRAAIQHAHQTRIDRHEGTPLLEVFDVEEAQLCIDFLSLAARNNYQGAVDLQKLKWVDRASSSEEPRVERPETQRRIFGRTQPNVLPIVSPKTVEIEYEIQAYPVGFSMQMEHGRFLSFYLSKQFPANYVSGSIHLCSDETLRDSQTHPLAPNEEFISGTTHAHETVYETLGDQGASRGSDIISTTTYTKHPIERVLVDIAQANDFVA